MREIREGGEGDDYVNKIDRMARESESERRRTKEKESRKRENFWEKRKERKKKN